MALVLIFASVAGQLAPYFTGRNEPVVFLSVDGEQNLPTFFSVLLILAAAVLLAVIAVFKKLQGAAYAFYWILLALGFMFMALDEATSLHEKLQGPMSQLLGDGRPAFFHFAWVVPGAAFALVMGLFFLKFLLHLPMRTRLLFIASASVYLGGAIAVELIGGQIAFTHGINSWAYIVTSSVEEGFEMAGMIVFIFALLNYLAETFGEVRFGFNPPMRVPERRQSPVRKVAAVPLKSSTDSSQPQMDIVLPNPVRRNIREPAVTP